MKNLNYFQLLVMAIFSIVTFWPWIKDLWSPSSKEVEEGMKGDNNRWDWFEIWERHSLRVGRGGWVGVWAMFVMQTMFEKEYPFFLWAFFFSATLGMSGIAAYMMKLRSQNEIQKNEKDNK